MHILRPCLSSQFMDKNPAQKVCHAVLHCVPCCAVLFAACCAVHLLLHAGLWLQPWAGPWPFLGLASGPHAQSILTLHPAQAAPTPCAPVLLPAALQTYSHPRVRLLQSLFGFFQSQQLNRKKHGSGVSPASCLPRLHSCLATAGPLFFAAELPAPHARWSRSASVASGQWADVGF